MSAPNMPTVIWAAPYPGFMQCGDWDVVDRGTLETPATSYTRTDLIPSDPRVKALVDAVEAALACGMIPKSTAAEGGANKYSEQVRVANLLRAALAALKGASHV